MSENYRYIRENNGEWQQVAELFAKVTGKKTENGEKKLRFPGHIWCQALNFFLSPDQWQHILEEEKMMLGLLYCMRQLWY